VPETVPEIEHRPVMLQEAIELLDIKTDGTYVDCTLGAGGHSGEILRRLGPQGRLIAFDKDNEARQRASQALSAYASRLTIVGRDFREIAEALTEMQVVGVDGIIFDLGVSSFQVLDPHRGFSYQYDAPLDMRMDTTAYTTAADLVNEMNERELADIIYRYGEERWSRRIASFIVERRQRGRIQTTGELVDVIKAAIPAGARQRGPHPAKRTFQALRITVNNELGGLEKGLRSAAPLLTDQGRLVVISFHSLEDRIVKNIFKELASLCNCGDPGDCRCGRGILKILTKKPLTPSDEELASNPRSRSAKLRAARRITAGKGNIKERGE